MKSIFNDLDQLIEQAVRDASQDEKLLQARQVKSVEKRGVKAKKETTKEDVEETEEESIEKIKGKPPEAKLASAEDKTDDETPGTKTSKNLKTPPESVIKNPKFDDISKKINVLRGSSSLNDKKVASDVKAYLATLKPAEKTALLTYLTNLSQIMTSVKAPADVENPKDVGIVTTFKGKSKEVQSAPQNEKEPAGVVVVGGK
jgi:hypothetical protein